MRVDENNLCWLMDVGFIAQFNFVEESEQGVWIDNHFGLPLDKRNWCFGSVQNPLKLRVSLAIEFRNVAVAVLCGQLKLELLRISSLVSEDLANFQFLKHFHHCAFKCFSEMS